ncbi:ATP-binding protein [Cupriavidus basilensis]
MNSLVHAFGGGDTGPVRGAIRIAARHAPGDEVVIRYADNGCGMPDALHEKIFEPLFTSRRGTGAAAGWACTWSATWLRSAWAAPSRWATASARMAEALSSPSGCRRSRPPRRATIPIASVMSPS